MAPYPLSPMLSLVRRAAPKPPYKDPNYKPGGLSIDPTHVNNRGFFALFALLGVVMVCAAIWFFFWAKNGGFVFRQGDWNDYKSTVLRRKGPNGTTLSGATKTTKLGGGSIVAEGEYADDEYADEEKIAPWRKAKQAGAGKGRTDWKRGTKNNEDADVRAYRHEKPARVGGLNRDSDGVAGRDYAAAMYGADDLSSNAGSGVSRVDYAPINTPRRKPGHSSANNPSTPTPKKNGRHSHLYSTPASNASSDSHRPLRPNAAHVDGTGSGASTPTRTPRHSYQPPHHDSPSRNSRNGGGSMPGSFITDPLDFESRYTSSEVGTEDSRGTKAYFHPMSGLGDAGAGRQKRATGGYRRGGEGGWRRGGAGTLSDSD